MICTSGTTAGSGNVISGNSTGVALLSDDNLVQGNLIGTDAGGTNGLGNANNGIYVGGLRNLKMHVAVSGVYAGLLQEGGRNVKDLKFAAGSWGVGRDEGILRPT